MSGGATAGWLMAAAAAASAAVSYTNGQKQADLQEQAMRQAKDSASKQEKAAQEANNRANQKQPNTASMLDAAVQAGKGGVAGTMLTGPSGVNPTTLQLGKNTLLGA